MTWNRYRITGHGNAQLWTEGRCDRCNAPVEEANGIACLESDALRVAEFGGLKRDDRYPAMVVPIQGGYGCEECATEAEMCGEWDDAKGGA